MKKNQRPHLFANLGRFLLYVFFSPTTIQRKIYEADESFIGNMDPFFFEIWSHSKRIPSLRSTARFSLIHILITPCLLTFLISIGLQRLAVDINWIGVILGTTFGVVTGFFLSAVIGTMFGAYYSVLMGTLAGMTLGMWGGGSISMIVGIVVGTGFGVTLSKEKYLGTILEMGLWGIFGTGVVASILIGLAFYFYFYFYYRDSMLGIGVGIGLLLSYYRVSLSNSAAPLAWLQAHHSYSDKSHPFSINLSRALVAIGEENRQAGMNAISSIAIFFKRELAAERALWELILYDLQNACSLSEIARISETLSWLPQDTRMEIHDYLINMEKISQHARAALESETLYNKQEQLRIGNFVIDQMRGGLAFEENSDIDLQMIGTLDKWKSVFVQELVSASGKEQIPNVYHSGTPLIKESKTFKGRRDLFRSLGNELINPSGQRPSLLLFGARRMGKSSTLKQLPIQLGPQIIPATIDLQSIGTVETISGLLYLIAREVVHSAWRERRLDLPELTQKQLSKEPYMAFQEWLEKIDVALGEYYWVLLALDEFESLGQMLSAGQIDKRFFQTIRGVIQHHPRVTILISGAHTLEELPPLWSNYLVNAKMLKVGSLEDIDARELITCPIENFPLVYDEEAISLLLYETGCHPNWLQLACRETVEKLNNEKRFHAKLEDVEYAVAKVPEILAGDFRDLWLGQDSDDLKRSVLKAIAKEENGIEAVKLVKKFEDKSAEFQTALDFLLRRDMLINKGGVYTFRSNLLRRWVGKQA